MKVFWNFVSLFGTLGAGLLFVAAGFLLNLRLGWVLLLNLLILTILCNTYKAYFFKPRPDNPQGVRPERPFPFWHLTRFLSPRNVWAYFKYVDAGSFPSIHSVRSFNQATLYGFFLLAQTGEVWPFAALYASALLIAWSRVVKLRHFKTDITAGAVIGLLAGVASQFV